MLFSVSTDIAILSSFLSLAIAFLLFVVFRGLSSKYHEHFIETAEKIKVGMSTVEVKSIMGDQTNSMEQYGDTLILIWERNQWRGFTRGGTLTRSVKVTFTNEKVTSIATKNFHKHTFW